MKNCLRHISALLLILAVTISCTRAGANTEGNAQQENASPVISSDPDSPTHDAF